MTPEDEIAAHEQYERDRIVAKWVLAGKPGINKREVQDWLRAHGYDHYLKPAKKL